MKSTVSILILAATLAGGSTLAFADTSVAEQKCIQAGIDRKDALENNSDPLLNGFANLVPEWKEQQIKALADPYRCSIPRTNTD